MLFFLLNNALSNSCSADNRPTLKLKFPFKKALFKSFKFSLKIATDSCDPVNLILNEFCAVLYLSIKILVPKNFEDSKAGEFNMI